MNILISGGCKNGKTAFAEDIAVRLSAAGDRYYVATMVPFDGEDRARIARHIAERADKGFQTIEQGRDIAGCLTRANRGGTFLIDSTTALLVNEMFPFAGKSVDDGAANRCIAGLCEIAKTAKNAVFVTDYLYADAARYDASTENFRAALAAVDRALAAVCDTVVELCVTNVICHKGGLDF
ncbi:MAG: bifunctional adenosylcobinamide kinase/adenosylcobinamide-phosphate guanylyltransferase [Clostridia bacterium]|nr:bifunctional adenosylcobinamide kinase/adenosylcobinamide-phosphate guanylyltransferase [Clostridia bacterium]